VLTWYFVSRGGAERLSDRSSLLTDCSRRLDGNHGTAVGTRISAVLNPEFIGARHGHSQALREWYFRQNQHVMPNLFGS